ncbi:hypothetical protein [Agrobacterium tumefaciens]|uniref:hypothetical protein n=1 Tax=Agrobacterium tumefaciens TaxID=358 RepID=UPI001CBCAF7C|nr:hypothetical protein [Agrobacterium tumefaciens]
MSLTTPTRGNRYQLPSWPPTEFTIALWNEVFGDLADRITDREQLEATFETLKAQGIQASLDYIQATVAPQIVSLQNSITLAQEQIDQIIIGGKAPDALKFGGQLPAYYATAEGLQGLVTSLAGYLRTDQRNAPDGVAPLGLDGKVPMENLPVMATTATVGAAIAGANGLETPDDGDALAGTKAGSSTMFRWTWGNIKAALIALFDGRYLKFGSGAIDGALADGDTFAGVKSGGSTMFRWTWGNIKGSLTSLFDGRYLKLSGGAIDGGLAIRSGGPTLNLVDTDNNQSRSVHHNSNNIGFLNPSGAWTLQVNDNGHVWSANYGWFHDRFAQAGAECQHNSGVVEFSGFDTGITDSIGQASNPYVVIGLRRGNVGSGNATYLRCVALRNR